MAAHSEAAAGAWTPLPLVVADDAGRLHLDQDALQLLQQLRAPALHVVGCFGPPATGKRLLLKTLLHAPTVDFAAAATKQKVLLWLWHASAAATASEDAARLVIASGIGADADAKTRQRVLALLFLLSSALVYNEDGEINDAALRKLAWLAELAQALRFKANQDEAGVAQDMPKHAPKLVWLARNFKIKWLGSTDGEKQTPTEYMEKCLAEENGYSEAVMQRNTIRMMVHNYFPSRECIGLSRAMDGTDEADPTVSREQLRSQFVEAVDKLYSSYLGKNVSLSCPTKRLLGRELRAEHFAVALQTYTDALNANNLPTVQHVSNTLVQQTIDEKFAAARKAYEAAIAPLAESIKSEDKPQSRREILLSHLRGYQSAELKLKELQAELPEPAQRAILKDGWAKWESTVNEQLHTILQANDELSDKVCRQLLETTLPRNLDETVDELASKPRESFSDGLTALLTQYKTDLKIALDTYKSTGAGPSLFKSLEVALLTSVLESVKTWGALVLQQYQYHLKTMQDELTQIQNDVEVAKVQDTNDAFSTDDHKRLYEDQLAQSTDQLTELRKVLTNELENKKSELERLMTDMSTMDMKHESRIRNTEDDIAYVRSKIAELEKATAVERIKSESDITGATEEILTKERGFHQEERTLMSQQKELMSRVVELERELVHKKTKHLQQVFIMENENAKKVEELKQDQAEFARQLRSQAKTDIGILKLAYQKKKNVVQTDIDAINREVAEMEEKLKAFDAAASAAASRTASRNFLKSLSAPAQPAPAPTTASAASSSSTSSSAARSVSLDVSTTASTIGPNTATRTATTNPDADLCKQS